MKHNKINKHHIINKTDEQYRYIDVQTVHKETSNERFES